MARPKGAKNKVSTDAKENILAVFTRLGGTAAMAKWAENHLTEFYSLYARLLPKQIEATVDVREHVLTYADYVQKAPTLSRESETTVQ